MIRTTDGMLLLGLLGWALAFYFYFHKAERYTDSTKDMQIMYLPNIPLAVQQAQAARMNATLVGVPPQLLSTATAATPAVQAQTQAQTIALAADSTLLHMLLLLANNTTPAIQARIRAIINQRYSPAQIDAVIRSNAQLATDLSKQSGVQLRPFK